MGQSITRTGTHSNPYTRTLVQPALCCFEGCVILERGQDTINFPPRDILYGDDWHVMWGETDGVFESLKVVNLRNLTHAGGDLIEESVFMQVELEGIKLIYLYV